MTKSFFLRDVFFLIATMVYILAVMFLIQKVNIWSCLGFFVLYIVFVVVTVVQSKMISPEDEEDPDRSQSMAKLKDANKFLQLASEYKKAGKGNSFRKAADAYEASRGSINYDDEPEGIEKSEPRKKSANPEIKVMDINTSGMDSQLESTEMNK